MGRVRDNPATTSALFASAAVFLAARFGVELSAEEASVYIACVTVAARFLAARAARRR